ncbi:UvrD-helicase domain-containing protein [Polymorphospora rubra]|uniref:UvrD-like helicase ATP-binding domain-containing protein n=1 Tax=Polymorphospora rubra TaxID=338584 RepID=A0A810MXC8_9ACTN|nr:UvrD-helicase domain-containing protein [Polymorphospora rubra]BCJ65732.1 hypothetical protein Prubr_27530 [Polymorphospora rubra]
MAGPGAGKTEFLAQRAAYLLQTAFCPWPRHTLAISFKRDAAANLVATRTHRRPKRPRVQTAEGPGAAGRLLGVATRSTHQRHRYPLTSRLVSGPFHRVVVCVTVMPVDRGAAEDEWRDGKA